MGGRWRGQPGGGAHREAWRAEGRYAAKANGPTFLGTAPAPSLLWPRAPPSWRPEAGVRAGADPILSAPPFLSRQQSKGPSTGQTTWVSSLALSLPAHVT